MEIAYIQTKVVDISFYLSCFFGMNQQKFEDVIQRHKAGEVVRVFIICSGAVTSFL